MLGSLVLERYAMRGYRANERRAKKGMGTRKKGMRAEGRRASVEKEKQAGGEA